METENFYTMIILVKNYDIVGYRNPTEMEERMKRTKRKGKILQVIIAICMVLNMVLIPSVCFAATPTLDSDFATLIVGTNDLKVEYYDGSQTMAGCFTAPEKGNYKFYAVNIGELTQSVYLLNKDFSKVESCSGHKTGSQHDFKTYLLEQGEKMYFYATGSTSSIGTLATRFVIGKEEQKSDVQVNNTSAKTTQKESTVKKSKITISQKSCSLKKGKKIKLKLKNNKKKVIWVSREKKIASVTSKGVVKGRKKGTTYIYAIANHKLYKCKVKVK